MRVYKFGGASVNDAAGVRNLTNIVSKEKENLVIVVSAFGKTTNALEKVLKARKEKLEAQKRKRDAAKTVEEPEIKLQKSEWDSYDWKKMTPGTQLPPIKPMTNQELQEMWKNADWHTTATEVMPYELDNKTTYLITRN